MIYELDNLIERVMIIDNKKIEEAAIYSSFVNVLPEERFGSPFYSKGFKQGARWAIDEFLKDLWHPASEEPKKDANCLVYISCEYEDTPEDNNREYTTSVYLGGCWSEDHFPLEADVFIIKWCYLDDILSQKGE